MKAMLAQEADLYMQAVPEAATPGVTRNAALKENVFAITVCIQVGGCTVFVLLLVVGVVMWGERGLPHLPCLQFSG
jgi:hypothetical protein